VFLTISTTGDDRSPATDLGFLLHKHPDKAQRFSTAYGEAHVFYPEASAQRCTAALLLDLDPVALVRRGKGKGRGGAPDSALAQYVNDRPYAASSLFAVALRTVFASALRGRCDARPELAERALPLRIEVPALSANGGAELVRRLFEPLGWAVEAEPVPLDERFPEWGESRYVRLVLTGECRVADALRHLYVLLPVTDGAKHYWVAEDEVDKLLRVGEGWLESHPEQALISRRYLARRWSLTRDALDRLELARLAEADDVEVDELDNAVGTEAPEGETEVGTAAETEPGAPAAGGRAEAGAEGGAGDGTEFDGAAVGDVMDSTEVDGTAVDGAGRPVPLAVRRREAVLGVLRGAGARRVLDLGCGQGQLVAAMLQEAQFTEVVGVDVSMRALRQAARRLRLERMPERQAARVRLVQGSLAYTDKRLKGYDAAVLSEVIEHVDPVRLPALEYAVFAAARPGTVVVTTPNAEYNVRWESLPAGHVRHPDHRFEWDRRQFREWAGEVARRYGYAVGFHPVGPDDPEVGPPTQMAVFTAGTAASTPTTHREEAPR
jgi:SAM-dependent methyltransferase